MNERRAFWVCLALSALVLFVIDAVLIHQSYAYFGGEALNRPFALNSGLTYALYGFQALLHDIALLGLAAYTLYVLSRKITGFSILQRLYLVFSSLMIVVLLYTFIKMQVVAYFGAKFNLDTLVDLADNQLSNIFSFVSLQQLLIGVSICLLLGLNVLLARAIGRWHFPLAPAVMAKPSRIVLVTVAWVFILVGDRFLIAGHQALVYGLSNKASFAIADAAIKRATDFDGDGFGLLTNPKDPNNLDSSQHAFALEVPGNGVDENGLAGDLPQLSKDVVECNAPAIDVNPTKNVILIVVETLRSDLIGQQIQGQDITPYLNSLVADPAAAHTNFAVSNYGVTARAIQTLHAGCLSYGHNSPFLFNVLRDHGYQTLAVSAQSEDWGQTDEILGFEQYDQFYDARDKDWSTEENSNWNKMRGALGTIDGHALNKTIFSALDGKKAQPFALYINYQDLHYPYYHDKMDKVFIEQGRIDADFFNARNRQKIVLQYANAGRYFDEVIKALFEGLADRNLLRNSVVVVVGDHPDAFYEDGILGHAWALGEHQKRTSLLVYNGYGYYTSPMGQDEVAGAIYTSLKPEGTPATITPHPTKEIFVLTGPLHAPRLIGLMAEGQLRRYNFGTGHFQINNASPWKKIENLDTNERQNFNSLIHRWESERHSQARQSPLTDNKE